MRGPCVSEGTALGVTPELAGELGVSRVTHCHGGLKAGEVAGSVLETLSCREGRNR